MLSAGKELQVVPPSAMTVPIGCIKDALTTVTNLPVILHLNVIDILELTACPIDGRPCRHGIVDGHTLEVVDSCFLGDILVMALLVVAASLQQSQE